MIHAGIIGGAAYVTVAVIQLKQKVTFEAKAPPGIPARKLEHSIRVKQMQKQARKPQIMERLVSQSPSSVSLPELPKMDAPDMKKLKDIPIISAQGGNLLGGMGGDGGGAGRGLTGGAGYSDTKFFGENVRTRGICILMDVSPSMVAKGVVQDVIKEAITMLEALGAATKFNIIVFVDGAMSFSPQMIFATQENKTRALDWLKKGFNGQRDGNRPGWSGSTPSEAIYMAVPQDPDTIFVLSDDPPYLKQGDASTGVEVTTHMDDIEHYIRNIEVETGKKIKINPIIYKPHENERGQQGIDFYKKIAQLTGGKIQVIKGQ